MPDSPASPAEEDVHSRDPRDGHLWTIEVTCRGASAIMGADDAEPHSYRFADWADETRPVQVQAHNLRDALRKAAELPLAAFTPADEPG